MTKLAGAGIHAAIVALALLLAPAPLRAQTMEEFFDDSVVHDLHLTLNSKDWASLKTRFTENIYYPTTLEWRDVRVPNVGIRSRGLGSRSGTKPGLRVDIDFYSTTQTFVGLKSFVLDNLVQDSSMLRERLSMAFFRRMGLPAPREAHTRLFVNGTFVGVYAIVESIDKGFLGRVFGEDGNGGTENDGFLFEYDYTRDYRFEYLGADVEAYKIFDPKTHEKDAAAAIWGPIEDMVQAINETPDPLFVREVSAYVDLSLFTKQLAIENFIAENDGILGYAGLNNFYLYRFEDSLRSQFLPWDKDNAFHSIEFNIMERTGENVLSRRTLDLPQYRNAYLNSLLDAAAVALDVDPEAPEFDEEGNKLPRPGWLEREVLRQAAQIRGLVPLDSFKPYSDEEFEAAIAHLLAFARERSHVVRDRVRELRGE